MRKKIRLIIIFYVLYFTWLLLVSYLWPNPTTLTYFLIIIVAFYFGFLNERGDALMLISVTILSYFIGNYLSYDPGFAQIGFPPLGIPFWPIAWGISALAFRKFYLLMRK